MCECVSVRVYARQQGGIAELAVDIGAVVSLNVFQGVAVGPFVHVDGLDLGGALEAGEDTEDGRPAAHVEHPQSLDGHVGDEGEHKAGGGVVGRAERHLGFNLNLVVHIITLGMKRCAHPDALAARGLDEHRLVLFLPFLVPVLVRQLLGGHAPAGGDVGELLSEPRLVVLFGGDIGLEAVGSLDKTVVRAFIAEGVDNQVAVRVGLTQRDSYFGISHVVVCRVIYNTETPFYRFSMSKISRMQRYTIFHI